MEAGLDFLEGFDNVTDFGVSDFGQDDVSFRYQGLERCSEFISSLTDAYPPFRRIPQGLRSLPNTSALFLDLPRFAGLWRLYCLKSFIPR